LLPGPKQEGFAPLAERGWVGASLGVVVRKSRCRTRKPAWTGLMKVGYNVHGVTKLSGSWTTLGRAANAATNFNSTNWNRTS
jgi:hypothetical protein